MRRLGAGRARRLAGGRQRLGAARAPILAIAHAAAHGIHDLAPAPDGGVWFTGQSGFVGRLALKTGQVTVKHAPRGRGPYGICSTPQGEVWWCSLAGSFIARIDRRVGGGRAAHARPGRAPWS